VRQLRLEKPPLRGTDVTDWQAFLSGRGHLTRAPDGVFGPITEQASRAYQTSAGIAADGIVGAFTLARALEDGLVSSAGPLSKGMDASTNCANFASKIAAGRIKFVVRYYSRSSTKALSREEARALTDEGLQIMTVYQDSNDRPQFFNQAIGATQAEKALELAAKVGQPAGSAIYFAVDFDPTPPDARGCVMEYFHAVHDTLAGSPYAAGVYGSGLTCRAIRDAGFAKFTWLSQSTGFREYRAFLPQADVVQAAPARSLIPSMPAIDDDIAQSADFGAFQVGA
jgi:peptidoglycan hydrolase-like protein with peptidoglycan-binding domain